jgi:hypothetical protein
MMEYRSNGHSSLAPAEITAVLLENIHPVNDFALVSKLSGGGVVVRVLERPETDKAFFGKRHGTENRFDIVQNIPSVVITPYQPIVQISYVEAKEEQGSHISFCYTPHPQANILSFAEWISGGLCCVAGLVGMQSNPIAVIAVFFGLLIIFFPKIRATSSFEMEVQRCVTGVQSLPLSVQISLSKEEK